MDYDVDIVRHRSRSRESQSKEPLVTIDDVLLAIAPLFSRLTGTIARRGGTKTKLWRLLAAEFQAISEALEALHHPTEMIFDDAGPWSSSPKYIGVRDSVFHKICELVSRESLESVFKEAGYKMKTPNGINQSLWRDTALNLWHLYGYLGENGGARLHAGILIDKLPEGKLGSMINSIKPLRCQLSNLVDMQHDHRDYVSWHPSGCDASQWNLFSLWYAILTTWSASPAGLFDDSPAAPVESCKLLLESTWSRESEGTSWFSLLLQYPEGLQEVQVNARPDRIMSSWADARQFGLDTSKLYCLSTKRPPHMGGFARGLLMSGQFDPHNNWNTADELLLATIITSAELRHQEKMILCLILARSLLDLHLTPWLREDWGLDDIYVFGWRGDGSKYRLDLRRPFLSVDLADMAKTRFRVPVSGLIKVSDSVHPCPHVLSLGIAIMQILLGDRLTGRTLLSRGNSGTTASRLIHALQLQEECEARLAKKDPLLRAIKECIRPTKFGHGDTTNPTTQMLWESVVYPLQEAILMTEDGPTTDIELWRFLTQPKAPVVLGDVEEMVAKARKRKFWEISKITDAGESASTILDDLIADLQVEAPKVTTAQTAGYSDELMELASKFLTPLTNISEALRALNGRHMSNAFRPDKVWDRMVRVVILDTGCDFSRPELRDCLVGDNRGEDAIRKTERRPGIVGWRDFVDAETWHPSDHLKDTSDNQHGTTMTRLFMTVMGHAKLYIGRVMDNNQTMDEQTPERVAEAIEYAITEWKADIISISLAIDTASRDIRERIKAAGERTLIFAAAGNNRQPHTNEIAFPASARSVICIHSHDGHGKPSRFSPNPQPHKTNFQVIGQDLRIPGTDGEDDLVVEGTSCSTPIAAAIGAFVFDFVQAHRLTWEEERHLPYSSEYQKKLKNLLVDKCHLLRDEQVMKRIFYECMTPRGDFGQHHLVNPEMLFNIGQGWVDKAVTLLGQQMEKVVESTDVRHY
ncbi:hypothetical protein VTK26DRAFT_9012 [Humicola hyalothermophila]